jgi:hypothetical protein
VTVAAFLYILAVHVLIVVANPTIIII